jgi:mRNA interferase RelE/StbE
MRVTRDLERFAITGYGDVKHLKGLHGLYRLRVGKWRVFFRLYAPETMTVTGIDNRGEAY